MADIQSNIRVNIDTSEALANIKALQKEISAFHVAMSKGGAAAAAQSAAMQQSLINGINSSGKFSASIKTISSTAETFTKSLEKNKLSLGEYFRYAGGASKSFGKLFKTEMNTIQKVAIERVKTLQTQYIKLGRDASGALKAIAVRPLALDMKNLGTQTALTAQKQQLLNQLLKQGSTNLLNFGKNTQWAGRQLMVGFTIPLATLGMAATKTFKQMEEQAIRFKRVYGDTFTASSETDAMLKQIQNLATEFTKYGVAIEDTMNMAATAAAAGKQGADLLAQVADATRLAVLGNVDQNKALETTISLTNAFGTATKDLRGEINFLNAVENQTVTSIDDLTTAIPKAAPVIKQLGGDVKDLSFFLTAMREGGINASEGANALKSGLASLINPTKKASTMLAGFGIDVNAIVEKDKGNVTKLVVDFAKALDTLDPLNRSRAIEQMFGKFQFARMSTLFQNVIKDGSQASKVLELMGQGTAELGILAQKELKRIESSPLYKFQKSIEDFKKELAPVGEEFMKAITPLINFGTDVLKSFNKLEPGIKQFIVNFTGIVAGLGPVLLMTFGLIANGVANLIKGFAFVKNIFNKTSTSSTVLGETTHYMTEEQLRAAAVAASLEQAHSKLSQAFTVERTAIESLTASYRKATAAQQAFGNVPGGPVKKVAKKKYARGTFSVPGPKGAGDIIPAMLSPGEAVIPVRQASKHRGLIMDIINNNLPGYSRGSSYIANVPKYESEAQKAHRLAQAAKIEEIRKKNLNKNKRNKPEALFVNQSLIPKLGLTGDSPIAQAIAASSLVKKLFIGNTTGQWQEFRSSPAFHVLRDAGLRENRYQTVPSTSFKELMKQYKMGTYNASGAFVQYFNGGEEDVQPAAKPKRVKKESRARNTSTVQGVLNMLRSHTGSRPRSWNSRLPQFEWEGMDKEISAGLKAAEEHMRSQGLPDSKISRNLNNLKTIQLSHLKPESRMFDVAGRQRSLKIWRSGNVIPDAGIYNQYLKEVGDKKGFFENIDHKKIAATSGMSESSVKKSIAKFKAGEHPTTPGEYAALAAIGQHDTGSYAGAAANAAFKASNGRKGFFKAKSAGKLSLDPSLDALAEKDLNNLVNRATLNIEKLEGKSQAIVDAEAKSNKKKDTATKKNVKAVEKNTNEVNKANKRAKKISTMEERLAAATEKVAKAREAIADPNNRKKKFNQTEIAANNLLLYGNPKGPTGDQRQSRKDALAAAKAERVAAAEQRRLEATARKQTTRRFGVSGLGAKLMAGGMAGSMVGGMIGGDVGNVISGVSNTVFTAAMMKDLFAGSGKLKTRIMDSKSTNIVVKGLQKAIPSVTKALTTVGTKLFRFIPYIGWAVAAFDIGVEGWKLLNDEQIKQAEVSKAITDTLNTTKEKLDSLNSYFGTDAKISGAKVAGVSDIGKGAGKVNLAKEFKNSAEFASTYKETAANLKNATKEQLARALQALGADLVGSGIGVDAAAIIIDAIQLEAGRSDVKIDPKSFIINTKDAKATFAKSSKDLLSEFTSARQAYVGAYAKNTGSWFTDAVNEVYSTADIINGTNFWQEMNMAFDLTHQKMVELAATFTSFWNGLGGQFQNGIIDAKTFNQQIEDLNTQIASMPEAVAIDLLDATMKKLNPDLYAFTENLDSASDKALVLSAALRGIQIPQNILLALSGGTQEQYTAAQEWIRKNNKGYDRWNANLYKLKSQLSGVGKQQEVITQTEDDINKKYDKRLSTLDDIISANDQIAKQQQGQLDIADALTQGDVAAAAKAMQQSRQDNASYALDQQKNAIDQGRQNALAPLEKQKIVLNDYGDTIQTKIDKQINNGYKTTDVPDVVGKVTTIREKLTKKNDMYSQIALGLYKAMPWLFNSFGVNIDTQTGYESKNDGNLPVSPTHAAGGHITGPGTGTSDSIPAMLSNGEYVIRAKAAKAIGVDTLDKMNHAEKFMKGGPINIAKYATGGLVGRYADGGFMNTAGYNKGSVPVKKQTLMDKYNWKANLKKQEIAKKQDPWNSIVNWGNENRGWAQWFGINSIIDSVNAATTPNAKKTPEQLAAEKERTDLFKKGGSEGFEAGFQGMMADMGTNPIMKGLGAYIQGSPVLDFSMSTLALPVNMIGTTVNNAMKGISAGMDVFSNKDSAFNQVMSGKMNYFEGVGKTFSDMVPAGLEMLGNQFADPFVSTYGHLVDKETEFHTGFEQAAQTVIDNKWFGTDTKEGAARARVVGGFLNIFGDPTTYLGAGVAAKAAATTGKAAIAATKAAVGAGKLTAGAKVVAGAVKTGAKNSFIGKIVSKATNKAKESAALTDELKALGIDNDTLKALTSQKPALSASENLRMQKIAEGIEARRDAMAAKRPLMLEGPKIQTGLRTSVTGDEYMTKIHELYASVTGDELSPGLPIFRSFEEGNLPPKLQAAVDYKKSIGEEFKTSSSINRSLPRSYIAEGRGTVVNWAMLKEGYAPVWNEIKNSKELKNLNADRVRFGQQEISTLNQYVDYLDDSWIGLSNSNRIGGGLGWLPMETGSGTQMRLLGNKLWAKHNLGLDPESGTIQTFRNPSTNINKGLEEDVPGYWSFDEHMAYNYNASDDIRNHYRTPPGMEHPQRLVGNPTINEMMTTLGYFDDEFAVTLGKISARPGTSAYAGPKLGTKMPSWYTEANSWFGSHFNSSAAFGNHRFGDPSKSFVTFLTNPIAKDAAELQGKIDKAILKEDIGRILKYQPLSLRTGIKEQDLFESIMASFKPVGDTGKVGLDIFSDALTAFRPGSGSSSWTYNKFMAALLSIQKQMPDTKFIDVRNFPDWMKHANGGMIKPKYFATGGMVGHYAKGGDVVPSMLTPGEFVINQPAVKKYGAGTMDAINSGTFGGGSNVNVSNSGTNTANSVYNSYSVNVNVSGDSGNPDAIAKTVIKEIKRLNSQGLRGVG